MHTTPDYTSQTTTTHKPVLFSVTLLLTTEIRWPTTSCYPSCCSPKGRLKVKIVTSTSILISSGNVSLCTVFRLLLFAQMSISLCVICIRVLRIFNAATPFQVLLYRKCEYTKRYRLFLKRVFLKSKITVKYQTL
jgi:hypothetical protein